MKQLFITDFDMKRFEWLISNSDKFDEEYKSHLLNLGEELKNAVVIDQTAIPPDVITMRSRFIVKNLETNEDETYTLAFPFDAIEEKNIISILSSFGTAVIGCKIGSIVDVNTPSGKQKIRIEEIIYQPESAGHYYI